MNQTYSSSICILLARALAIGFTFFSVIGCDQKRKAQPVAMEEVGAATSAANDSPSSSSNQEKPPAVAQAPTDAATAQAIVDAGGQAKSGKDGMITEVVFRDTPITDAIAAQVGKLSKVTKLSIYSSEMSSAGWESLGGLSSVQHLDLRGCKVGNTQLVAAASSMPRLRSLRLNGKDGSTTVDDDGLSFLEKCKDLKVLAIDHLWVSVDSLAKLPNPDGMLELYAATTLIDDEALATISSWKGLKKLRAANTSVSNAGLADIESMKLEELDLSECQQFDDSGMASVGKITTLKRLNLWRTSITDAGVAEIAPLVNLTWLNLDNIPLSDDGLKALSEMQKLEFLHLGSTQVTDSGMEHLVALESLNDLRVTRTAVTEDGVQPLREAHPKMNIQIKYVEGQ
ncbi:MAG: hypothetical protein Aurels2KO_40060 [Aureliella sp.]